MFRHLAGLGLILLLLAPTGPGAGAETPMESARALLARYHENPRRIDEARDLLEAELRRERRPETVALLSRVYFLFGEIRATTDEEKLAAYGRGRELGQRAVELAPRSEDAHLWYVINTGRWGQTKGVMRSLFLLPELRRELDTIFELNPRSVRGHAAAGNIFFEVPPLLGGDKTKAEEHFRKGLAIDPQYTVLRTDLARLLIAGGRYAEARRELERVIDEKAPSIVADWTVKDLPRARELLASIKDKR